MQMPSVLGWVVIGVVVGGATFVFWPVTTCGGIPAKRSECLSHVKQMALANLMYAYDYDDRLPLRNWMDATLPYARGEEILHCPSFESGAYGYALNSRPTKLTKLPDPVKTELVYDSTNLGRNASDPVASLPNPGRHDGRNTVGYCDGHARSLLDPAP